MRSLCDGLPDVFLVIGNLSIPTRNSFFYECDVIVTTVEFCDIVDAKGMRPDARVFEDCITGVNDFSEERVFSILENKAKVLAGKLHGQPFSYAADLRVNSRVVVPNECCVKFDYHDHARNQKVLTVNQLIDYYNHIELPKRDASFEAEWRRLRSGWKSYQAKATSGVSPDRKLGRFLIKKVVKSDRLGREYLAQDEPPCKMDVHLKEFNFSPLMGREELERHLATVSRDMQTRRRMRHPYIACVTGHFQTGMSLVQVSDWFDGRSIEESWAIVKTLSLDESLPPTIKITQGVAYCHQENIFHRNIHAGNVLISGDCNQIRVTGFEFAKDLELTGNSLRRTKKQNASDNYPA